jgi:hypothetical protein
MTFAFHGIFWASKSIEASPLLLDLSLSYSHFYLQKGVGPAPPVCTISLLAT